MARKPKDLYTVLQARRKVGKGSFRGRAPAGSKPQSLMQVLADWWAQFTGRPRPAARGKEPPPKAGILVSGPALAAIVFASLGIGFLLGDWIGGTGGDSELRAAERSAAGPERPGPVGDGIRLDAGEETQVLSDSALVLAVYTDGERQRASAVAEWARRQGIDKARIYRFWNDETGMSSWVVLAYFAGSDPDPELVARLRALPPSADEEFERQRKSMAGWPPVVPIR